MKQVKAEATHLEQMVSRYAKPAVHPDAANERVIQAMSERPRVRFMERFFKLRHDNVPDADRTLYASLMARAAAGDGTVQLVGDPVYASHGADFTVIHLQWIETDREVAAGDFMETAEVVSNPVLRGA